jgi:hypothetical protein
VPTFGLTLQFNRDFAALAPDERQAFRGAVAKFIEDLPSGRLRKGLRVRGIQGAPGIFEMTWAGDGRATFQYGPSVREGEPHVIWRRVGTHQVFGNP